VPIPAGVVRLTVKATLRAAFGMTAEAGGATRHERIDDALLNGRYRVRLRIAWGKATQNIGQFKAGAGLTRGMGYVSLAGLRRSHGFIPSAP
jgi:hypothetical protein